MTTFYSLEELPWKAVDGWQVGVDVLTIRHIPAATGPHPVAGVLNPLAAERVSVDVVDSRPNRRFV
ncbi:MAG: hypothetical protein ACK5Q5_13650 [Planctomycetaceae bacterium]